jgi:hypothetical protein
VIRRFDLPMARAFAAGWSLQISSWRYRHQPPRYVSGAETEPGERGISAVRVEVRNSGHTPAREISMHARANILPYPLPDGFDLDLHDGGGAGLTIGAQTATPYPFPIRARTSPEEIEQLRSGKFAFYVMLGVYYTDVFNRRHTTILCSSADGAAFVRAMERTDFKPGDSMQGLWGIPRRLLSSRLAASGTKVRGSGPRAPTRREPIYGSPH